MSEERERFDPISIVLVIAVLLLGLMTWLDGAGRDTLTAQVESAKRYKSGALTSCQVEAVGVKGRGLLIACPGDAHNSAREKALGVLGKGGPTEFDSVAFRDSQGTVVCPTTGWPEGCGEVIPLQDRAFFQKAKRRRVKTSQ